MTDEEIVNKACRACSSPTSALDEAIRLARADEREKCAKVADAHAQSFHKSWEEYRFKKGHANDARECGKKADACEGLAAAIRAGKGDDLQKGGER